MAGMLERLDRHRRRRQLARDYAETFNSPAGRRVLEDLAAYSRFGRGAIVAGDPHMTHYLAGQQDMVRYICERLSLDLIDFTKAAIARSSAAATEEEAHQ